MHTEDKAWHVGIDPVCVNWTAFKKHPNLNPKDISVGRYVYFIRKRWNRYYVMGGFVYDHYHDGIAIQCVTLPDRRMVKSVFTEEPVPFAEFPWRTDYAKLPKGWTWNTQLFEIFHRPLTEEESRVASIRQDDPDAPSRFAEAYQAGILVNVRDVEDFEIKSVIDKQGYYLVKDGKSYTFNGDSRPIDTVMLSPCEVFLTYEGASEAVKEYEAELKAQAEMTDLEWAEFEIRKDVERWAALYHIQEADWRRTLEFLLNHKELENLETRLGNGTLLWRVYGKTRWNTIPIE